MSLIGRDWQKKRNGGQWILGKTFDTFCPLGPVVNTALNPENLKIQAWIDDDLMQDSYTSNLIFDIPVSDLNALCLVSMSKKIFS